MDGWRRVGDPVCPAVSPIRARVISLPGRRCANSPNRRPRGSSVNSGDKMNEHAFGVSLGLRPRTPPRCPASPSTVAGSTPIPASNIRSTKNKAASDTWSDAAFNSGDRIRTCDLRVMSPTSYQTALPRTKVIRAANFRSSGMHCQAMESPRSRAAGPGTGKTPPEEGPRPREPRSCPQVQTRSSRRSESWGSRRESPAQIAPARPWNNPGP